MTLDEQMVEENRARAERYAGFAARVGLRPASKRPGQFVQSFAFDHTKWWAEAANGLACVITTEPYDEPWSARDLLRGQGFEADVFPGLVLHHPTCQVVIGVAAGHSGMLEAIRRKLVGC